MGTLWHNGTIYTMAEEGQTVEALFTSDGIIKDMGTLVELKEKWKAEIEEKIDLEGGVLFPGFVDSHMHLIGHGETLMRLNLSKLTSKQDVLKAVQERTTEVPEGQWIIGDGWNENLWEQPDVLTREELDSIAPDHPVMLNRICRHAIVANSRALENAGIHEGTPSPTGGVIEKDTNGMLNGLLKDKAQDLLTPALPDISSQYLEEALTRAIKSCWSLGLVGGHTEDLSYYGDFNKTYQSFLNIIEQQEMKFRAHLLVHHTVVEDWKKGNHSFLSGGPFVEFGAMKIFSDGALGGRTALLSHPYADDPSTNGVEIHSKETLEMLLKKAREYDMPIAVHTIGDLAFEHVLDAVELYPTVDNRRDRFIHAQILRRELIDRIKPLPIVLDIQPRFVASDFPWVIERIGADKMEYNYAWKLLLDEGIPCSGGSDAPIEPVDPLLGIHAAVTRTNPLDPEKTVYQPEQRLSMYEAISLFTKGSAYACHHEHNRGMLQPGFDADFTVLPIDPFRENPDELLNTKVKMTIVDETIVYQS